MKPILSARNRSSSFAASVAVSTPSIFNDPLVGRSKHPSRFTSVLLPEPEGPVIATHSPATIENVAPSSARTTPPCPAYSRVTPSSAITAHSARVCSGTACSTTSATTFFTPSAITPPSKALLALQQRRRLQSPQHPHRQNRRQHRDQQVQQQHQRQHADSRQRRRPEVALADRPRQSRSYDIPHHHAAQRQHQRLQQKQPHQLPLRSAQRL